MGMEVDHSNSEGTAEEASPSPPPPDLHKFNKAGTIRWAENVRDETGVAGESFPEGQAQSQEPALYPSGSSSRTGSNPELTVLKPGSNGNSSSSSANGDRTSRSSGSGGVYLTTTSLATSVSGASTASSIAGGSKEKVNIEEGVEGEGGVIKKMGWLVQDRRLNHYRKNTNRTYLRSPPLPQVKENLLRGQCRHRMRFRGLLGPLSNFFTLS
jgi:hypothetical protein